MSRQPQNDAFARTSFLQGANAAYIEELQAQYEKNPGSVSDEWRLFFQSLQEEQGKATAEAKKLMNTLEARRSKSPEDKDLFLVQPETHLAGAKLLGSGLDIKDKIGVFLDKRLVSRKADFAWEKREMP